MSFKDINETVFQIKMVYFSNNDFFLLSTSSTSARRIKIHELGFCLQEMMPKRTRQIGRNKFFIFNQLGYYCGVNWWLRSIFSVAARDKDFREKNRLKCRQWCYKIRYFPVDISINFRQTEMFFRNIHLKIWDGRV